MKIGIIGFGSVGKRHFDNSISLGHSTEVHSLHNKSELKQKKYDLIIVASKTSNHYKDILRFKNYSDAFLIEKPLAKNVSEGIKIKNLLKKKSAMVGYTMIFNPIIVELKKILTENSLGDIYHTRIHCGSYLPNWRTGDYRKKYSAIKKEGGGVLRELVHELNYAQFLFPDLIKKIQGGQRKLSHLEISSEDMALIVLDQKKLNIVITLNYFQRLPEREIRIYGKNGTLLCDLVGNTIKMLDQSNNKVFIKKFKFERNQTFMDELGFAIRVSMGKTKIPPILSLNQAVKDLKIINIIDRNTSYNNNPLS